MQQSTGKRTAPLGLRIRPELKEELERFARADRRSMASYVEIVLEEHVAAKKTAGKKK